MFGFVWLWLCGWFRMLKPRRKGQKWPPENSGIFSALWPNGLQARVPRNRITLVACKKSLKDRVLLFSKPPPPPIEFSFISNSISIHLLQGMWVLYGSFFVCSKFYQFELHTFPCVALANPKMKRLQNSDLL